MGLSCNIEICKKFGRNWSKFNDEIFIDLEVYSCNENLYVVIHNSSQQDTERRKEKNRGQKTVIIIIFL